MPGGCRVRRRSVVCTDGWVLNLMQNNLPMKPGYYWAKLTAPTEGTHEGDEWNPSAASWEIVEVWANHIDWYNKPEDRPS